VLPAPSLDSVILGAVGEAALGIDVSAHWNADFDNVANRGFMADFQAKYKRLPTCYASQGYDTALAIGAALFETKGQLRDTELFRRAMLPATFQSVRGRFRFGPNQHPIQDWWALRVEKGKDGTPALVTRGRVFQDHGDAYAAECRM